MTRLSSSLFIVLELPVPDFKQDDETFSNCLLLHRLLVTGGEEELLRTKLSSTILSRNCQYKDGSSSSSDTTKKVSIPSFCLLSCLLHCVLPR